MKGANENVECFAAGQMPGNGAGQGWPFPRAAMFHNEAKHVRKIGLRGEPTALLAKVEPVAFGPGVPLKLKLAVRYRSGTVHETGYLGSELVLAGMVAAAEAAFAD